MPKTIVRTLMLLIFIQPIGSFLWAGFGMTSTFAKVNVGSVEAGDVVRLSAMGRPLTVTNTSDIPVTLSLRVTRPKKEEVDSGFEPIPTVVWAVLEKNEFTLAPGESASTDVILKPSLEQKYRNRNYQLHILSRVVGSGNIRIVMVHKVQFSVPKHTPVSPKIFAKRSQPRIRPKAIEVDNVDLGRLSADPDRTLVVENADHTTHRYRLRTFNPEAASEFEPYAMDVISPTLHPQGNNPSSVTFQPGEQTAISPSHGMTIVADELLPRNWVSMGVKEFELKPGEKRRFPIKIFVPNQISLKNKKVLSLVRVTQLDGDFPSTLVPVYIETTAQGYADVPSPEFQKPTFVDVHTEME